MVILFSDGRFLVSDAATIKKVGQEGSTVWRYEVGQFSSDLSRIQLGPDQIVYYSMGTAIASLDIPATSEEMASS